MEVPHETRGRVTAYLSGGGNKKFENRVWGGGIKKAKNFPKSSIGGI